MSCDPALEKLSEKLNSRVLVQEEHSFQMCPLAAPKMPGLDRVKVLTVLCSVVAGDLIATCGDDVAWYSKW